MEMLPVSACAAPATAGKSRKRQCFAIFVSGLLAVFLINCLQVGCSFASPRLDESESSDEGGIVFFGRLSDTLGEDHAHWRTELGEVLENRWVLCAVVLLVLVDLLMTSVIFVIEDTQLLNPELHELAERIMTGCKKAAVCILLLFVVEEILHFVAFGWQFFRKPWFVIDVVVVLVSLVIEWTDLRDVLMPKKVGQGAQSGPSLADGTSAAVSSGPSKANLQMGVMLKISQIVARRRRIKKAKRAARLIMFLQLWKVGAFCFDIMFAGQRIAGHMSTSDQQRVDYIHALEHELRSHNLPLPPMPAKRHHGH